MLAEQQQNDRLATKMCKWCILILLSCSRHSPDTTCHHKVFVVEQNSSCYRQLTCHVTTYNKRSTHMSKIAVVKNLSPGTLSFWSSHNDTVAKWDHLQWAKIQVVHDNSLLSTNIWLCLSNESTYSVTMEH